MAPGSIDGKPRIYEAEPTDQFCYNFVIQIFLLLTDTPSHVKSLTPKFSSFVFRNECPSCRRLILIRKEGTQVYVRLLIIEWL